MAYMKNVLIDSELSRRLPFRPRGNTGGPRLSKALDGYVAAHLCPQIPYKANSEVNVTLSNYPTDPKKGQGFYATEASAYTTLPPVSTLSP